MKQYGWLLLLGLGAMSSTAGAGESVDCSQIANTAERLACFDRAFPGDNTVPAEDQPEMPQDASAPEATSQVPRKSGLFDRKDRLEIHARIKAVKRREQQKMVFLLDNGQIWVQSSPRALAIRKGDTVKISSATIGGYLLTTGQGTTTRVKQIQ